MSKRFYSIRNSIFRLSSLIVGFIAVSMLFASCGLFKKATATKIVNAKKMTAADLMQSMIKNQVNIQWLNSDVKFAFTDNGSGTQKAYGTLKYRKDSLIWMNVKKLGIEFARIQITKDSVYLIDRMNGLYSIKPLDFLKKQYNLPADFNSIQAILLGNPIFFSKLATLELLPDQNYLLKGDSTKIINSQYEVNSQTFQLVKMAFEDRADKQSVNILYDSYTPLSNKQNFAYFRRILMNSPDMGELVAALDFSDVEVNIPQTFRFSIPSKYVRMD